MIDTTFIPDCFPDTVRFRIPVPHDLYEQFEQEFFTDKHKIIHRDSDGYETGWEKAMVKYPSSFNDMVIMPSGILTKKFYLREAKGFIERVCDSIDVEYSVHKWCFKSSAFNNGALTFDYIYQPVDDVLGFLGLSQKQRDYSRKYCFLRRIDLSCNFNFDSAETGYTVADIVNTMLRFKFNRADFESKNGLCNFKAGQSVRWGNSNSLYSVIFYDKAREYRDNWKERQKKRKPISSAEEDFYLNYVGRIKDLLRFEVNFTTRWFNQGLEKRYEEMGMKRIKHPQGPEQIQTVIDLSAHKWGEIYKLATGPLSMKNVDTLTNIRLFELEDKLIADDRKALYIFARECLRKGWKTVKADRNEQVFYRYKKQLKELYHWDITTAGPELVEALHEEALEITRKPMSICLVSEDQYFKIKQKQALEAQKINASMSDNGHYVNLDTLLLISVLFISPPHALNVVLFP